MTPEEPEQPPVATPTPTPSVTPPVTVDEPEKPNAARLADTGGDAHPLTLLALGGGAIIFLGLGLFLFRIARKV